jgi:hypothetical protein
MNDLAATRADASARGCVLFDDQHCFVGAQFMGDCQTNYPCADNGDAYLMHAPLYLFFSPDAMFRAKQNAIHAIVGVLVEFATLFDIIAHKTAENIR